MLLEQLQGQAGRQQASYDFSGSPESLHQPGTLWPKLAFQHLSGKPRVLPRHRIEVPSVLAKFQQVSLPLPKRVQRMALKNENAAARSQEPSNHLRPRFEIHHPRQRSLARVDNVRAPVETRGDLKNIRTHKGRRSPERRRLLLRLSDHCGAYVDTSHRPGAEVEQSQRIE